jgi:replicative DNA helicase
MKPELIQLLLKKDFYQRNKHRVHPAMFEGSDLKPLYRTIVKAHEEFSDTDFSFKELELLFDSEHPSMPPPKKQNIKILLRELAEKPEITEAVGEKVLTSTFQQAIGEEIADIGMAISAGEIRDLQDLKRLIEKSTDDFTPLNNIKQCTLSPRELFSKDRGEGRWKFNIRALQQRVPGIAPGDFTIVFARPETGKTGFHVSLCYGPEGFAEQGAKIATFVNEEPSWKTRKRAMMSYSGISEAEAEADHELDFLAKEWGRLEPQAFFADTHGMSMAEIDAYCEIHKPDILVIDQLDHVHINGTFTRTDEKLKQIYADARNVAIRHNLAIIAVSQASAEAEGKTRLNPTMMDGSKTGKFATADLIIGIGRHENGMDEEPDFTRHLCVGKNKISGWHGTIVCLTEPRISRYVD